MIKGIAASDSTLFTILGWPNRPLMAGNGGLERTKPRLPSRLSSKAVFHREYMRLRAIALLD